MPSPLRALVVEDNADLGAMLVEYLKEVGHEAATVASAEDALALLEAQPFDVLMTDVSLPGMSGIALATKIAERWPRMGLVISSGYGDALDLAYFPPALVPVVVLVPKPCDLEKLPQQLADAAAGAQTRTGVAGVSRDP